MPTSGDVALLKKLVNRQISDLENLLVLEVRYHVVDFEVTKVACVKTKDCQQTHSPFDSISVALC